MIRKKLVCIIGFFVLFAGICYAQQRGYFNIISFEKGLNTQSNPFLVPENQCITAQNIRFNERFGSIAKRPTMLQYGDVGSHSIHGLHRYYKSNGTTKLIAAGSTYLYIGDDDTGTFTVIHEGLTDSKTWQFFTYQDMAICANGYDNTLKYDGHTTTTANTDAARTASNLCADLGAPYAELNTGANLTASKWYQYKVAYYDGTNYYYSTKRSNAILTGSTVRDITLTDIPLGEKGTTARYVYRTLGNTNKAACLADTTFYKIATISDNTTTTINDAMTDATAVGDAAPTWATVSAGTDVSPPKGSYNLLHKERMFVAGNTTYPSLLYWSDEYNPDYFDPVDYAAIRENDGDKITFLKEQLGIVVVGKTNTIQKFYTEGSSDKGSSDNWYASAPFSFTGCYAPYTAVNTPIGLIYLARAGLYRFNGQQSELISDAVTPEIEDVSITNSDRAFGIFQNNEYSLAYTSTNSGSSTNNRVLIYDIVRDAYTIDYKNLNVFCVFNSGSDFGDLYSGTSTTDGVVWAHEGKARVLSKNLKSEFELGTFDDARVYGTENEPVIELAWDCTIDGWLTELQTKNASINTIDDINIYLPNAIIDRPDTAGTWTSPVYFIRISSFDKIYWNENLGTTGDITFQIRTGASEAACLAAAWSTAVSDPSGSDISALTANSYVQVRANLSTTDINYTPTLFSGNGYVFKIVYYAAGNTSETDFLSVWESGWLEFGAKNYPKLMNQIRVFYEGTAGTLTFEYKNNRGTVENTFTIDMSIDPDASNSDNYRGEGVHKYYTFIPPINTSAKPTPIGEFFKFKVTEQGTKPWKITRIETEVTPQQDYP